MINPSAPTVLPGTRILLSGTGFNVALPENIKHLKDLGVTKIFLLFPTSQNQLDQGREFKEEGVQHLTLEQLYSKMHLDLMLVPKLQGHGIMVSSLLRNPRSFRDYDSFYKEASEVKGKFLIQCIHGRHASAAYAMYYLAKGTRLSVNEMSNIFLKAGFSGRDLSTMEYFLSDAKVNLSGVVTEREKIISAQMKSIERNRRKHLKRQSRLGKGRHSHLHHKTHH